MRHLKHTILILLNGLMIFSCDNYLSVYPKTEIVPKVLFNTESGFKEALTGVYISMKADFAYGNALTMGTIEYLVSSWDAIGDLGLALGNFDYNNESAESYLASIFTQEYKIIANINSILRLIDAKKDVFLTPGMYKMIKGECLALRAYCHFDILRLFGPLPTDVDKWNSLPYVTVLSTKPNEHIPFVLFQEKLFADLADAEALLQEIDPVIKYSEQELLSNKDRYFYTRKIRMNYYAVKALQARAYLWFNNKGMAYQCAKAVLNAKNSDNSSKFRLGTDADMEAADYRLSCEQIFGLHDYALAARYEGLFASAVLRKGTDSVGIHTQLYESSTSDIRGRYLWEKLFLSNQSFYTSKKYKVDANADGGLIPMLRTSEMYMVAIETTSDPVEAQALWDLFCVARGLVPSTLPSGDALRGVLLKEFRKEFYAEGQAFFAYKRLNATIEEILFASKMLKPNYLIPMPKVEILNF